MIESTEGWLPGLDVGTLLCLHVLILVLGDTGGTGDVQADDLRLHHHPGCDTVCGFPQEVSVEVPATPTP